MGKDGEKVMLDDKDDGEVEHPDRQIAFTQISDFAQMS